jgi:hypothetical protein
MGGVVGDSSDPRGEVAGGYAALALRYRFLFDGSPFDMTAGVLAGPGGVSRSREGLPEQDGAIFVFEPQVEGNLNVARWLRVGADLGYRLVAAGDQIPASELHGVTAGIHVQLGWF